jgi:hypothetical protein
MWMYLLYASGRSGFTGVNSAVNAQLLGAVEHFHLVRLQFKAYKLDIALKK